MAGFLLLTQHGGGTVADREMIGEDLSAFSPHVAAASLEQASYPDPRDDFAGSDRKRKPSSTRLRVICIANSSSVLLKTLSGASEQWRTTHL